MKKQLIRKLLWVLAVFVAVNGILCWAASAKTSKILGVSAETGETALFILMEILVIVIGTVHPLAEASQRRIYWIIAEIPVILTIGFWGFFIVGPIWFR